MNFKNPIDDGYAKEIKPSSAVDDVIEKKLEDIVTVLCSTGPGKSNLYEEVLSIIERCLFKIALKRSNNVKSTAAAYLGIHRNTFQKKMIKFGINCEKNKKSKGSDNKSSR
ncbi:MAG: helix-turn-helix domain-containing protein [Syntrophales bacterium]